MRITKPGFKVLYFVVAVMAGFVLSVIAAIVIDAQVVAGILVVVLGLILFGASRLFRGPGEDSTRFRESWRATNKPLTGYVLGLLFAAYTVYVLPFTIALLTRSYPTEPERVVPPTDYLGSLIGHLLAAFVGIFLAVYYLQSSVRMVHRAQLEWEASLRSPAMDSGIQSTTASTAPLIPDEPSGPVIAKYRLIEDRRLSRRFANAYFWRSRLKPAAIGNFFVGLALACWAAAVFVSGALFPRAFSGFLVVCLAAVLMAPPVLAYRRARVGQRKSQPVGAFRQTMFTESGFSMVAPTWHRNYRFRQFRAIEMARGFARLESNNGGRVLIPIELLPPDRADWVRERIAVERAKAASEARTPLKGEPREYQNRFVVEATSASQWARARVLVSIFDSGPATIIFWADILVALWGAIGLFLPTSLPSVAWIPLILAGAYAVYIRTVFAYRTRLDVAQRSLTVGDVWESHFTSTDLWLCVRGRARRFPYTSMLSVRIEYGFAFIRIEKSSRPIQIPTVLFTQERLEWLFRLRASQLDESMAA